MLEWTTTAGKWGSKFACLTPQGYIRINRRSFRNLGIRWVITFPTGQTIRAETDYGAKDYAERWLERQAQTEPSK
jgi:hypothetical protein